MITKTFARKFALFFSFMLLAIATQIRADGWHNAALSTGNLDDWLNQLKRSVPDLEERLEKKGKTGTSSLQSGRGIDALRQKAKELDGQGKAPPKKPQQGRPNVQGRIGADMKQEILTARVANDCLEVMQFMNRQNIIPREFPTFDLKKMPEYKKAAQQILEAIGSEGTSAAVQRTRSELMGQNFFSRGLVTNEDYHEELFKVLDSGRKDMTKDDYASLYEAAAGKKPPAQADFARRVNEWLADAKNVALPTLLEWARDEEDNERKRDILAKVRKHLPEAGITEIAMALAIAKETSNTIHRGMLTEIGHRIPKAGPLDLLMMIEADTDKKLTATAVRYLSEKSPRYSEIKDDLADIWTYLDSDHEVVIAGAKAQIENAYLRAPISECLLWLSKLDAEQQKILWKQIEIKIGRADAKRKESYQLVGVRILLNEEKTYSMDQRLHAIEFLRRMKDPQAVGPVVDVLTSLPQELWPAVGSFLRELTGQNFGPRRGDKVIDVFAAKKEWQRWLRSQ